MISTVFLSCLTPSSLYLILHPSLFNLFFSFLYSFFSRSFFTSYFASTPFPLLCIFFFFFTFLVFSITPYIYLFSFFFYCFPFYFSLLLVSFFLIFFFLFSSSIPFPLIFPLLRLPPFSLFSILLLFLVLTSPYQTHRHTQHLIAVHLPFRHFMDASDNMFPRLPRLASASVPGTSFVVSITLSFSLH